MDKTKFLVELGESEVPTSLSRPRHFDKSLTVSPFEEMFLGNRELFKGTYAYDNWDFTKKSNVIKLDMSSVDVSTPEELNRTLLLLVLDVASEYQVIVKEDKLSHIAFKELIKAMASDNGVVFIAS